MCAKMIKHGVVAAANRQAAEEGLKILEAGGNAVDAAIATALAMGVTHPIDCGIGGGGFMLCYNHGSGETTAIDFQAQAPASTAYTLEPEFLDFLKGYRIKVSGMANELGASSVAIPGALAGFDYALKKYGSIPWEDLFAPAIWLAEKGFIVDRYLGWRIESNEDYIETFAETKNTFHPGGRPYRAGDTLVLPELASTLKQVAAAGPDLLYNGPLGEAITAEIARGEGFMTMKDLSSYRVIERVPVSADYKGCRIYTMPPPSTGAFNIMVLKILDLLELGGYKQQGLDATLLIKAVLELAIGLRAKHLGDPAFVAINPDSFIGSDFLKNQAAAVKKLLHGHANEGGKGLADNRLDGNTTHLSVLDKDFNAVALTYTNMNFSGLVVPEIGVVLNNSMLLFNPWPGTANSVEPGKRMASSMSPTIVLEEGKPKIVVGASGGPRIPSAVLQTLINIFEYGLKIGDAISAPRLHPEAGLLHLEESLAKNVEAGLVERGIKLEKVEDYEQLMAIVHCAACTKEDGFHGAADPRGSGYAAVY